MKVCVQGQGGLADRIASEFDVEAIGLDDLPPPECDGAVIVAGADPVPSRQSLVDMAEREWRNAAEGMPFRVMRALQRARDATLAQQGNLVVVVPTVGLIGAGGLAHYVTGVEAIRAMVKSAARQWATDRIGVALVAVPLALIADVAGDLVIHVGGAARKDADLPEAAVRAVTLLLSEAGPGLTGSTLVVDGGAVMAP